MCSLNSSSNRNAAAGDSDRKPSHLVSPDLKKGTASAIRSTGGAATRATRASQSLTSRTAFSTRVMFRCAVMLASVRRKAVTDDGARAQEIRKVGRQVEMRTSDQRRLQRGEHRFSVGQRLEEFQAALGYQSNFNIRQGADDEHVLAACGNINGGRDAVRDIHLPYRQRRKLRSDQTERRMQRKLDRRKLVGGDRHEGARINRRGLG